MGIDMPNQNRRPDDVILDRYMPQATEAEREAARANLQRLAEFVVRVERRLAKEWHEQQIRESGSEELDSSREPSPCL